MEKKKEIKNLQNNVKGLDVKCKCCWASDKVCEYCVHYEYFRDAYRCRIDDKITGPRGYCSSFRAY